MLPRWSRAITLICKSAASRGDVEKLRCGGLDVFSCRGFAKVADAVPDFGTDDGSAVRSQVWFCFTARLWLCIVASTKYLYMAFKVSESCCISKKSEKG